MLHSYKPFFKNYEKKISCRIIETSNGFVDVEASSEEEAREKAYDAWANGYAVMCGDIDCETEEVWLN